ncbi:MAG TPA: hypothetical protein VJ842_21030 [Pyrinomonadaceae bacterium]|nr:hypothetical protein [Pyrinomonadaceae bacterium]
MKHLRRIGVTLVLVLVFANVTSADEGIMYPGYVPPPPPPHMTTGIMYPGVADNKPNLEGEGKTVDLATEFTLSLVQNLLALF